MKHDNLLQELAAARKVFLEVLISACFGTILGVYFTFFVYTEPVVHYLSMASIVVSVVFGIYSLVMLYRL